MSKRNKRRKERKTAVRPKFQVGDRVRVLRGVADEDYPDIPLGGWAGTVVEIDADGTCLIRWSAETLAAIHPVVKKRAEKDGADLEEYWLSEVELEPDPGGPPDIEQPVRIVTKPLSPDDEEDRIRTVFGLTSDDPLPEVSAGTLRAYYKHLSESMGLPLKLDYIEETGPFESIRHRVTILRLIDPEESPIDETDGLECEARIDDEVVHFPLADFDVVSEERRLRLLQDYCFWFWNYQPGCHDDPEEVELEHDSSSMPGSSADAFDESGAWLLAFCGKWLAFAAFYGAVIGSALRVIDGTGQAVYVGGSIVGALGVIFLTGLASFAGSAGRVWRFRLFFGTMGGMVGGGFGAILGAMAVAWMGAVPGIILGLLLGRLRRGENGILGWFFATILGGGIGTAALAFWQDVHVASQGAMYGAAIGAGAGAAIAGVVAVLSTLLHMSDWQAMMKDASGDTP